MYWHVRVRDYPNVGDLAQQARHQLAACDGLHMTPPDCLHITTRCRSRRAVLRAAATADAPDRFRSARRRSAYQRQPRQDHLPAKVTKRYDTATIPHRRAIDHETVRKRPKITMNAEFKRLKPATLSRQILAKTGELETSKCSFRLH